MRKNIIFRFKNLFNKINTFLSGQKVWNIYIAEHLKEYEESKDCPSEWHGSGCYDREVYALRYHRYIICAKSKKEAERIYDDYILSLKHSPFDGDTKIIGIIEDITCNAAYCNKNEIINFECSNNTDNLHWSTKKPTADIYEAISSFPEN